MSDTLASRLKQARSLRGLTQVQLAALSGVKQPDISKIERGEIQKTTSLLGLARALRVNPHWLDTGDGDMEPQTTPVQPEASNVKPAPAMRLVPVLNKVNAGMYKEIVEAHPDDIDYVPVYTPTKRYTFALRVDGDSMEPGFPNGCVVIVDPEIEAKPNDYVIAMNGDNESTFKQLIKDGPDFYLRPRNPRYPIKPLGTARIIGVVCGIQLQAKPGDPTWPV